jgi:hypothetical protein
MAFTEDLSVFTDVDGGFAVAATLAGEAVRVIFDAPGADLFDGQVATTEPSALIAASDEPAVGQSLVLAGGDLPAQLAQHAGSYSVRSVMPEGPDGAFVRAVLAKVG